MERAESPVSKIVTQKDVENKLPLSPKIPKSPNMPAYRQPDQAGRYVRDSPNNFRRTAEHRRESPRNAEPVRKSSRDPNYMSKRKSSDNIDERRMTIEKKAQKLLNSPYKPSQDGLEFYNTAPSGQSFKSNAFDIQEKELSNEFQAIELNPKLVSLNQPPKPPTGRPNK